MRVARWSEIRGIGNSLPARMSLAAPIIGYLIIFNDLVSSFVTRTFGIAGTENTGNISYTLYLYFYGLILFSIGSFIFLIFADRIVKGHPSHVEYIISRVDDLSPEEVVELCDGLHGKLGERASSRFAYIRNIVLLTGACSKENSRDVLYWDYKIADLRSTFWRGACFFAYTTGIALLALPSAIFAVKVTLSLL